MDSNATLAIHRVTKRFDHFTAVKDLSLRVPRGTMYGLLGPNGAGKTTTLRVIMNIILPDEGTVEILGQPMSEKLKEHIGYLPEERGLYPKMKVGDTLMFLGEIKGMSASVTKSKMNEWLERLDLSSWKEKKINELSKGMQQKIQFIATVIHEPDLIILDEPFAGLDPLNADLLKDIMLEMKAQGRTIIFSTHRMEQVEKLCDHICLINKAEKVLDGNLREIKRQYGKNTVVLEYTTDGRAPVKAAELSDPRFVASLNDYGHYVEFQLKPGAEPQAFLKLLVEKVRVQRFELTEPPLNEIFKEKVRESAG